MAQATAISLSRFTASVDAAVKAAVKNHPKFQPVGTPSGVTVAYLIRGIPVPDALLKQVSLGDLQGFANDVAGHIAGAHPQLFAAAPGVGAAGAGGHAQGAVLSVGGHVIVGIPPAVQAFTLEK